MAIVAMKHLRLLGMESEREALLKAMQDMECVEISSIDGSEEALKSGFAKPDDKALMSAQEASRAYRTALASTRPLCARRKKACSASGRRFPRGVFQRRERGKCLHRGGDDQQGHTPPRRNRERAYEK